MSDTALLSTPLARLHQELGARMVPFAGYSMPVQYPSGLMTEHLRNVEENLTFDRKVPTNDISMALS